MTETSYRVFFKKSPHEITTITDLHLSFLTSLLSFIFLLLLFFSFLQRLVSLFLFTALSPLSSWLSLTLHSSLHLFSALSALFCLLFLRFLFWSEMAHRDVCHVLVCVCCGLVVRVFVVKLVCVCVCVCVLFLVFLLKNNGVCTLKTFPCELSKR